MMTKRPRGKARRLHLPGAARLAPSTTAAPVTPTNVRVSTPAGPAATLPPSAGATVAPIEPPTAPAAVTVAATAATPSVNAARNAETVVSAPEPSQPQVAAQVEEPAKLEPVAAATSTTTTEAAATPPPPPQMEAPVAIAATRMTAAIVAAPATAPVAATPRKTARRTARKKLATATTAAATAPVAAEVPTIDSSAATGAAATAVVWAPAGKAKRLHASKPRKGRINAVMVKVPVVAMNPLATPAAADVSVAAPSTAAAVTAVAAPTSTVPAAATPPGEVAAGPTRPPRAIGFTRFTRQQLRREQRAKSQMKRLVAASAREQRRLAKAEAKAKARAAKAAALAATPAVDKGVKAAATDTAAVAATETVTATVASPTLAVTKLPPVPAHSAPTQAAGAAATEAAPKRRVFFDGLAPSAPDTAATTTAPVVAADRPVEAAELAAATVVPARQARVFISPDKLKTLLKHKCAAKIETVADEEAPKAVEGAAAAPAAEAPVSSLTAPVEKAAVVEAAAAPAPPAIPVNTEETATLPPRRTMRGVSKGSRERQLRLREQKAKFERLVAMPNGMAPTETVTETVTEGERAAVTKPVAAAVAPKVVEAPKEDAVAPETVTEAKPTPEVAVANAPSAHVAAVAERLMTAAKTREVCEEPAAAKKAAAAAAKEQEKPKALPPRRMARGMSRASTLRQKRLQEQKERFAKLAAQQATAEFAVKVSAGAATDAVGETVPEPSAEPTIAVEEMEAEALLVPTATAEVDPAVPASKAVVLSPMAQRSEEEDLKAEAVETAPGEEGGVEALEVVEDGVEQEVAAEEAAAVAKPTPVEAAPAEVPVWAKRLHEKRRSSHPNTNSTAPAATKVDQEVEGKPVAAEGHAEPLECAAPEVAEPTVTEVNARDTELVEVVEEAPVAEAKAGMGEPTAEQNPESELPATTTEAVAAVEAEVPPQPPKRSIASAKRSIRRHSKLAALRKKAREQAAARAIATELADADDVKPISTAHEDVAAAKPVAAVASDETPLVPSLAEAPTTAEIMAASTPAEALVNEAIRGLKLPSGDVTVESFTEKEMVMRRSSVDAPWHIGLHFDWTERALALDSFPSFPPSDPRSTHPYVVLFQSKPMWYLQEVNGANAARMGEVMNAMKRTLTARFVFKQVK